MSGPNTDYDPVEVSPLSPAEVEAARDAALAADRRRHRPRRPQGGAHRARRRPLAARAGQPRDRRAAAAGPQGGRPADRPGPRRGQPGARPRARACSRPSTRSGCWSTRPSTSRCPPTVVPAGARAPVTTGSELIADIFVAMGWEVAEGPVLEAEWLNFDALNLGPDHPARTMQDTFWTEPADHGVVLRTHTSPVQARTMLTRTPPIYVVCPGPGLPHRRVRRHPQPGLPPGRGPRRRRGHLDGPPQGHPGPLRHPDVRRGHHHPLPPVVLPLHRAQSPRSTWSASCAAAPSRRPTATRAAPVAARAGSSGAAAAWSTRGC